MRYLCKAEPGLCPAAPGTRPSALPASAEGSSKRRPLLRLRPQLPAPKPCQSCFKKAPLGNQAHAGCKREGCVGCSGCARRAAIPRQYRQRLAENGGEPLKIRRNAVDANVLQAAIPALEEHGGCKPFLGFLHCPGQFGFPAPRGLLLFPTVEKSWKEGGFARRSGRTGPGACPLRAGVGRPLPPSLPGLSSSF